MRTLIIWMWAFWVAVSRHLSKNNPNIIFYAYEKDVYSFNYMKKERVNPYFFTEVKLPSNIVLVDNLQEILPTIDIIILAIPNQFIQSSISQNKEFFKSNVCFLNLSKGIDNSNLFTVSDTLSQILWSFVYRYAILSGWMIAQELIEENILWADLWVSDLMIWEYIKSLFENQFLHIKLYSEYKNIELYSAIKNIIAIYIWYLEWKWYKHSSLWYYFCELLSELPILISLLWWKPNTEFSQFSLWWDLIATCFWNSRNRYFWRLVWSGKTLTEAMKILKQEKKHAEWYETLRGIGHVIESTDQLKNFQKIKSIFLP